MLKLINTLRRLRELREELRNALAPIVPNDGLSPAERYAKTTRETAVGEILKTIKSSKSIGMLLVLLVIAVSFQHQREYFMTRDAGELGSIGLPLIFDVGIIFFVRVISTKAINQPALWLSVAGLQLPLAASAKINFEASSNEMVGWAYVAAILLVALIEVVKAVMKANPKALRETETSADASPTTAPKTVRQITKQERDARRRAGYDAMSAKDKRAWTKRYAERIARTAPQSPAWVLEGREPSEAELDSITV